VDWLRELLGFVLPFFDRLSLIRAILGFALVFFLPGFAWTLVFFKQLNIIERVSVSFVLSSALVTLSVFSVNRLFHLAITGLNSALVIVAITVVPLGIYGIRRLIGQRKDNEPAD